MDVFAPTGNLYAGAIWPEVVVTLTLLLVLVVDLIGGSAARKSLPALSIFGLIGALVTLVLQWQQPQLESFLGSFAADPLGR